MRRFETIEAIREHIRPLRAAGRRIGFVPTMGAIHEGHRSLLRAARSGSDQVVASIFVNPAQFAPGEDYSSYPHPLEADLDACRAEGVDAVFCPSVEEIYPGGAGTTVHIAGLTEGLCGPFRVGHFDGVTTVVAKLFIIVEPDVAYFGQKDAQQGVVIRRMVRDLLWPIQIVVCPTVREPDGLALSSRNAYLSIAERKQAGCLFGALEWAGRRIELGHRDRVALLGEMRKRIEAAGPCSIDYIELVDAEDLSEKQTIAGRCLIALAVRIGSARLIDNIVVDAGPQDR